MDNMNFVDRVKKHFEFLETEYSFIRMIETNSDIRPQTDGSVEYKSESLVVVIDSETGFAALWFYRVKDGRKYDLDPVAIHEYLNTSDTEKKLLLSTNVDDNVAATELFNRRFLLYQDGWEFKADTAEKKVDLRLANYANWLKDHADICLKDDFSKWLSFYEYKINRARADHLRTGRDELGYARVKDADGKSKLIKQSIFQDKLDYVERLKKEFPE